MMKTKKIMRGRVNFYVIFLVSFWGSDMYLYPEITYLQKKKMSGWFIIPINLLKGGNYVDYN